MRWRTYVINGQTGGGGGGIIAPGHAAFLKFRASFETVLRLAIMSRWKQKNTKNRHLLEAKTFINSKILIDTSALIPTGVAISEDFFTNNMQGRISDLIPSDLSSANGASSNSTMKTVGQLEVRIRFNQMSTIFSGSAVVLKNLSLPVIYRGKFFKN